MVVIVSSPHWEIVRCCCLAKTKDSAATRVSGGDHWRRGGHDYLLTTVIDSPILMFGLGDVLPNHHHLISF